MNVCTIDLRLIRDALLALLPNACQAFTDAHPKVEVSSVALYVFRYSVPQVPSHPISTTDERGRESRLVPAADFGAGCCLGGLAFLIAYYACNGIGLGISGSIAFFNVAYLAPESVFFFGGVMIGYLLLIVSSRRSKRHARMIASTIAGTVFSGGIALILDIMFLQLNVSPTHRTKQFNLISLSGATVMNTSRRSFMKATAATTTATVADSFSSTAVAAEREKVDSTVSKCTGPHGVGLPLTIAGYEYSRVRALTEGRVTVEGCATRFEVTSIGPLNNHAFFGPQTRDVTEIGLIPYILAYANDGFRDYALLPIPILRLFRHQSIFVRTDKGIRTPADLRGRKVATVGYSSSGLTHVRGILEEEYGVKPNEIEWVSTQKDSAANLTGGVSNWEKIRPEGISITDAPAGEDESSLLLNGKVDAIFHPAEPKVYQDRNPLVARLFTDHRTVERDFFKRTGVFPIMHTVAIRKKSIDANPQLPKAVFEAYSKAKTLDYEHMRQWGWVVDSLPWYGQEFTETRELMGENFYPYGLKACAASYATAIRFVYDQGLSKRKVSLEEMFEPSIIKLEEKF